MVVPRKSDVRKPEQERQNPQILVGKVPIPTRNQHTEDDAFDVKFKGTTWEDSSSHLYFNLKLKFRSRGVDEHTLLGPKAAPKGFFEETTTVSEKFRNFAEQTR
jgi:hypothetical protein